MLSLFCGKMGFSGFSIKSSPTCNLHNKVLDGMRYARASDCSDKDVDIVRGRLQIGDKPGVPLPNIELLG